MNNENSTIQIVAGYSVVLFPSFIQFGDIISRSALSFRGWVADDVDTTLGVRPVFNANETARMYINCQESTCLNLQVIDTYTPA